MIDFGPATYGAGFAAGALSTLSPCALPLLPILAASALSAHRHGKWALAAGLGMSFAAVGLFVATLGASLGLSADLLREPAAALMVLFGLFMMPGPLQRLFARALAPVAGSAQSLLSRIDGGGLAGQFGVGLLLGIVWSPCAGPTLGAASTLASQGRDLGQSAVLMAVFGLGAALPLLLLATVSRASAARVRGWLGGAGRTGRYLLGAIFVAVGTLILTGADKPLQAALLAHSPDWLLRLTTAL